MGEIKLLKKSIVLFLIHLHKSNKKIMRIVAGIMSGFLGLIMSFFLNLKIIVNYDPALMITNELAGKL